MLSFLEHKVFVQVSSSCVLKSLPSFLSVVIGKITAFPYRSCLAYIIIATASSMVQEYPMIH